MRPYKFIISGGGTGGHIYPAIAIANELQRRFPDAGFLFVGAKDRMEMEKVPQAGYSIQGLWISGIQRKITLKNLLFPFKLISSLIRAGKIVRKFKPDVAIGTGGYASAPLLRMASKRKVPCLIQEQNSFAGITNKWLKNKVQRICVAYDGMERFFPSEKIVLTGNPVREDLIHINRTKEEAMNHFELNPDRKTLLVLGGSLGAGRINEIIDAHLNFFDEQGLQVIWQCGKLYEARYKNRTNETIRVHAFLQEMDLAYTAADIIVSRAGALSVSELCIVGKPVIFIPSPNVAEDHQTKNALSVSEKEAAVLLKESEAHGSFVDVVSEILYSEEKQATLAKNIKKLARPMATSEIVDEIVKLIPEK